MNKYLKIYSENKRYFKNTKSHLLYFFFKTSKQYKLYFTHENKCIIIYTSLYVIVYFKKIQL